MAAPVRRRSRRTARAKSSRSAGASGHAAEARLLVLARELTARSSTLTTAADLHAIIETLAAAYGPEAPLAVALRRDWLHGRGDKSARLALGWAREQLRLAIADVVTHAAHAGLVSARTDADTLAWLWLAGCEALAHEPASAVADRVHALVALLGTI